MSSGFPKLVGYRFHPTDEELISYYLKGKNSGRDHDVSNIPVIDVLKYDPWQLPQQLGTDSGDDEWYFFCKRDVRAVRRGKSSSRSNRATKSGFWKPTGKDRNIRSKRDKKLIGTKKTLVFYRGKSQHSSRTTWVMHEYRSISDNSQDFVLYLLKDKSEKTGDVSTPQEVEPGRSSASPVTSPSDALSPNRTTPVMNMEPGNHPTASPLEEGSFLDEDYEIQQCLEIFGSGFTAPTLDGIWPPMPQPPMIPNHGPSNTENRFLHTSTRHCADTLYQYDSSEPDESISVLSADIPESSDTDDEVTQSVLFESSTTFTSKSVTPRSSSYKETILTKEIVGFETENSGNEDPGSEIVMPEAGKKLSLQPIPEGTTRTRTTTTGKGFFMLVENSRLKDGPRPPFVYVANIFTATVLLIALVAEVLF